MEFFSLDFWMWVFKISVSLLSAGLVIFAVSPGLFLSLGRNFLSIDNTQLEKREAMLKASGAINRVLAKSIFAMVDNRPLTAGLAMFVLLFSSFLW